MPPPVGKGPGEEDALGSTRAPFGAGLLWGGGGRKLRKPVEKWDEKG